ncbi:tetratricopeptide repeat protein [Spirochaetota bacterium]
MTDIDLNEKVRQFLKLATENFVIQNFEHAIRDLKAAEVLDKDNPEILYNLGVNYSRLGLYKTSIEYFEKLLNLPSAFVEALVVKKLLAYAYINIKEFKKAQKILDDVVKLSPSDTVAYNMKGYCLEKQDNWKNAIKVYRLIIDIDDNNFNAYNSLAYLISKNNGDLDESLEYSKKAHESNNKNPAYIDTLGFVYLKRGNREMAKKFLGRALELKPFSVEIKEHINELQRLK